MALTNEVLEQRMRAQTDMIQHVQALAGQAFQKVNSLDSRLVSAQAEAAGALASSRAALKAEDTTQKLLKELIQEIKDLREDGTIQQKQIDQIRKEMDEFKELINNKVNRCYQEIQAGKTPNIHINGGWYGTTPYEVTCSYPNDISVTSTYDEDGNPTGHTAFMELDTTSSTDTERKTTKVEISDNALNKIFGGREI